MRLVLACLAFASLLALPAPGQTDQPASERARAWEALRARLPEVKYQRHSLAVEAIMREMAVPGSDNVDHWALAGLLHDIDIAETAKDLSRHGIIGAQILRELRFPPAVVHAVNAHDDRAGVARSSRLDHGVHCADQVYWLVAATGHAIPSDRLNDAVSTALWDLARQLPAKQAILGQVTKECAEIGLTMPRAVSAVQAASRKMLAAER